MGGGGGGGGDGGGGSGSDAEEGGGGGGGGDREGAGGEAGSALELAVLNTVTASHFVPLARGPQHSEPYDAARWVERPELLPHPVEHYDAKISSRMTVCRLRGEGALHRRLDIKVYPRELLPFALLYFTGSDYYNRSLRAFVNKVGWQLSDKGLCRVLSEERVIQGGKRARVVTSRTHSVKCANEEDVLRAIGAPWKAPHERDA